MMNTLLKPNRRMLFAFGTFRLLAFDHTKMFTALQGKKSIRIWTLENIIERAFSGENNIKSFNTILSTLNEFLKNELQNENDSFNIVVNKYFSSIQNLNPTTTSQTKDQVLFKNLIEIINSSQKWRFLPHYQNIINRKNLSNCKQLKLLIGDYNDAIIEHFPQNSYVTLEQLCAMYPQKVPLSYRKRQLIEGIRQGVGKRLSEGHHEKMSLTQEPRFNEIFIINDRIKMWDEAYQVMLDELPIKITVPFHVPQPSQKFHRLNLHNFISGFKQCHRIIHPEIPLEIQQQSLEEFITEFFSNQSKGISSENSKLQVQIMDSSFSSSSGKKFEIFH